MIILQIISVADFTLHNTDADTIRRVQRGDAAAFDALVQEHYALAFNTALRMLGEREMAADATQSAFVRAFKSLSSFRGDAAFATWLYRIVINVCLDQMRNRPRNSVGLSFNGAEQESERPLTDEGDDPAAAVERRQRQRVVHEALVQLAPEHRTVVVLYDLAGLPYDDIAYILQVPLGTVKSRLNRARHALKDVLGAQLELFE